MEGVTLIELGVFSCQVLRNIQRGGESPDLTFGHAVGVSLIDSPEVVLVVEESARVVGGCEVVGPVNHDFRWRIGGAKEQTIGGGVVAKRPGEGHRSGDVSIAIGRIRIVSGFRNRKDVAVDVDGELIAR